MARPVRILAGKVAAININQIRQTTRTIISTLASNPAYEADHRQVSETTEDRDTLYAGYIHKTI